MKFFSKILIFLVIFGVLLSSFEFVFAEETGLECGEYLCGECESEIACRKVGCFWYNGSCYSIEKNAVFYPSYPQKNFVILKSYTYGEITICLLLGLIWLTLLFDVLRKTFSKNKNFVEIISKHDRLFQ